MPVTIDQIEKAFLMGGSNDPYALSQMIQAQQGPRSLPQSFSNRTTMPAGTTARELPDLNLTKKQYEHLKLRGMLEHGNLANHFMRVDTPDGLSDQARWVLHAPAFWGAPVAMTLSRKIETKRVEVAPADVTPTFEQSVEVLQAINVVRKALGITDRVTEEELRQAQNDVLQGAQPLNVAAGALQNALMSASNPTRGEPPNIGAYVRRYIDAKIERTVNEKITWAPKNKTDERVLATVNAYAEQIARDRYRFDDAARANPDVQAQVQREAWDQWAEQRVLERATARNKRMRPIKGTPVERRPGGSRPAPGMAFGIFDPGKGTLMNPPDTTEQAVIDQIAQGDVGFDIDRLKRDFFGEIPA